MPCMPHQLSLIGRHLCMVLCCCGAGTQQNFAYAMPQGCLRAAKAGNCPGRLLTHEQRAAF